MIEIAFFEPTLDGHRGAYLVWMAGALTSRGHRVTAVVAGDGHDAATVDVTGQLVALGVDVRRRPFHSTRRTPTAPHAERARWRPPLASMVANDVRSWTAMRAAYLELVSTDDPPDLVFVPYLDTFVYSAAIAGSPFGETPWASMSFRTRFHFVEQGVPLARRSRIRDRIDRTAFWRLLRQPRCRGLFTPDATLEAYASAGPAGQAGLVVLLREPGEMPPWSRADVDRPDLARADLRGRMRRRLGIDASRNVVLVYGVIGRRKGLDALLAATRSRSWPRSTDVLVAGEVRDEVKTLLSTHANVAGGGSTGGGSTDCRWHVLDRYCTLEEEHELFAASDVVWLGYRGHPFSSAVMVRAAFERLPVVAGSEGLIGVTVRDERLGQVVDIDDADSVATAISRAVATPWRSDVALMPATQARSATRVRTVFADTIERWSGRRVNAAREPSTAAETGS